MKKLFLIVTSACLVLTTARAQEKIPQEKIQSVARKLLEQLGDIQEAQVKIVANPDRGDGIKSGEVAALVLPDKNLTLALLEKLGSEIVPVGQLYFKALAPAKEGKATPIDKLRTLTVNDNGVDLTIPICLLGARKRDDRVELVVFGNEKTPLIQVALRKADGSQDMPIELSAEKQDEESAGLTLSILGKFKATFVVMKQSN
jgi:hypothetical protein